MDREMADIDKLGKDFVDVLQHKSTIQAQVAKLRDLNSTIAADFAKI